MKTEESLRPESTWTLWTLRFGITAKNTQPQSMKDLMSKTQCGSQLEESKPHTLPAT